MILNKALIDALAKDAIPDPTTRDPAALAGLDYVPGELDRSAPKRIWLAVADAIERAITGAAIDNDKRPSDYKAGIIKGLGDALYIARRASARPSAGADDRFEQYVATLIDKNPNVRLLGERLADWLDEDRFNSVNPILLGICERLSAPVAPAAEGLTDAQCEAVYQAVMMSGLTRDVKSPERKREIVREALSPAQPEAK